MQIVENCGDACLELNFGLGYKGDALPDLDFIKVTPFLDLDFAWAIKVTPFLTWISAWAIKETPSGFGFHKGDALPGPGFRLGLLKRTPLGPEFRHGF
ncbi:unnamed protein product [Rhizophagus irregularis]|nr:unnamed protein product [Rhizophagus irregularis]